MTRLGFLKNFRDIDIIFLVSIIALSSFGFIALYSVGLGKDPQNFFYIQKQASVFAVFFTLFFIVGVLNYRIVRSMSFLLYIALCGFLFAVLVSGHTIRGTRGWFMFGSFGIQPAEFAKLALVCVLARYFSGHTRQIGQFRHIAISAFFMALPVGLVLLQPDVGSAVVLFLIWFGMMMISGIPKKYIFALCISIAIVSLSAWLFFLKDYQKDRIIMFLRPSADIQGSGYNVRQAIIAIGSGQIFGRGLGFGSQSHLKFLPETQTDFIFSVVAEEMGLVGVSLLFIFWMIFFHRLIRIMKMCRDDFAIYSVLGISIMFFSHVILNIGGNLGLVPLTGIPLPFLSYGGSFLAVSLLAVGLAQSIKVYNS
jgi:rod shape determining protein RodA